MQFEYGDALSLHTGDARELLEAVPENSVDLVITSPPYFIGKAYDSSRCIADFEALHNEILPLVAKVVKPGGSICWQTGYHVSENQTVPLDFAVHQRMSQVQGVILRNRIIWRFGHGLHATRRFSGRHETILWYTKGSDYHFDLDAVRVAQKYPGKRHFKGPNKGELSGNPKGKNPADIWDFELDVWDIPNVKGNHVEKTEHPCQFPVALPKRLIGALCPPGGLVLDPFMGAGSAGVAALLSGRRFLGFDADAGYSSLAAERCQAALAGTIRVREDVPVMAPDPTSSVAKRPEHFLSDATSAAPRRAA